jgi:hypothetical protein
MPMTGRLIPESPVSRYLVRIWKKLIFTSLPGLKLRAHSGGTETVVVRQKAITFKGNEVQDGVIVEMATI